MEAQAKFTDRLHHAFKRIVKRTLFWSALSALFIFILMITPFWSGVLHKGLTKVPVQVVTENSLLKTKPKFIVVLGGGLGRSINNDIIPNRYTRERLKASIPVHKKTQLPLILSGLESPWMKDWLEQNQITHVRTEEKSNNTCENANFTTILLKNHGVNHVYLVTGKFHMARARRQFARLGIHTTPIPAEISRNSELKWDTPINNFRHSRRAVYESLALVRDQFRQQKNCRVRPPLATL